MLETREQSVLDLAQTLSLCQKSISSPGEGLFEYTAKPLCISRGDGGSCLELERTPVDLPLYREHISFSLHNGVKNLARMQQVLDTRSLIRINTDPKLLSQSIDPIRCCRLLNLKAEWGPSYSYDGTTMNLRVRRQSLVCRSCNKLWIEVS